MVDGDHWRAHLREVADQTPGLVPVAKGNGYGLGLASLARRADWLKADTLAVGGYEELPALRRQPARPRPPGARGRHRSTGGCTAGWSTPSPAPRT